MDGPGRRTGVRENKMVKNYPFREGLKQGWDMGVEEGTREGMRQSILEVLRARFGDVLWDIRNSLWDVKDEEDLKDLIRKAISAESLEEFLRALESHC